MTTEPTSKQEESRNPFQSRRFTQWWIASLVAGSGVGIQAVSVPLYVRDRVALDERAAAISAALLIPTLPGIFLVLFGGSLADRIEQRRILMVTYSIGAVVSTAYIALCFFDARSVWPVFLLAAIVGSAGAFTNPARQSMLPQLVTRSQLQNAVILGTMAFMASLQFLGPTLGGLIADWSGLTAAFTTEMILLALAAILFSRVRTEVQPQTGASLWTDLREGVRYVASEPALTGLLLLGAVPGIFFIGPFSVTVPILVPDVFNASDKWVGLLWGCFGAGVFIGSVVLTFFPLPRRGLAVCSTGLLGGLILLAYSQSTQLQYSVVILVIWGMSASVFMNYVVALLQEHAEPRMIGRVMSMYSLTFFASMPIGYTQAGVITTNYGPQTTLFTSGVCAALVGLAVLLFLKPVRELP